MVIYINEVIIFSSDLPKYLHFHLKQTCTINEFNFQAAKWNESEQPLPQF